MSAMEWKTLSVDALRPAAYNPRKKLKAGDKEYEKIKNSILEFGYVEPIIVNYDMTVIGGHQRLTVLKDLGYTEVQCVVVHIEDEHKVKALNIALNKITGAWNEQLLADLLVDLQSVDFNTDLTGFEAPEIEQLFSKVHNKDIKEDDFDVEQELKNPPAEHKEAYDTLKEFYDCYLEFTSLATNPNGNLQSYTNDYNDLDSEVMSKYKKMEMYFE